MTKVIDYFHNSKHNDEFIHMIIDNIYELIAELDMKPTEFQRICDMSSGYLANIKKRRGGVGEHNIMTILSKFPEVNPLWLLTGKGDMFQDSSVSKSKQSDSELPIIQNTKADELQNGAIPIIPIDAVAGLSDDSLRVMTDQIEEYLSIPDFRADFVIRVYGDSMYPYVSPGDFVACRRIRESSFIQWNKIYVLDTSQGTLIKRVMEANEKTAYSLVSVNEKYPPFDVSRDEIRSMSIVVGIVRFEP